MHYESCVLKVYYDYNINSIQLHNFNIMIKALMVLVARVKILVLREACNPSMVPQIIF